MKPVNMGTVGTCTNNINRLGKKIISAAYVKNIQQLSSYVSKKNRTFSNSNSIYVKHKPAGFKFKKKKKKNLEKLIFFIQTITKIRKNIDFGQIKQKTKTAIVMKTNYC